MSARPHRLHLLVILLAAALPATSSWSASIGALQVHSFLGQPLLATVSLNLSEDENLTMLDCIRTLRADDDLAGPGLLRQELFVSSRRATLHLQGLVPLSEPLVSIRLSVGCNEPAQLQRDYTLLLDPPPVAEMLPASAPETPLPSSASSDVKPINTPATSARPLRPPPIRAKRAVSASKAAAAAAAASGTTSTVAAAPNSSASPANTPNSDDARPILKIETASATEIRAQDLENELQVLQNQHAQLRVEMTQLEQRMALLQVQLENKVLATAPVASAPVPQGMPQSDIPARRLWLWLVGGGLTALLLAAAAWLLARRNNEPASETDWLKRPMTPTELDVDTLAPAKTVAATVDAGIEVADDDSELDQAQFLLSEGQALEAIDLLYNVIEKEPTEVRAWLMLLRTLCQRDNPQEFAAVAERFKATAPVADDWDIVLAMGRDLEPDNPLYTPMRESLMQSNNRQPTLDFFIEAKPEQTPGPAPKLDIGLESLPEDPIPGDSPINQISRRDAA